jgi:hypothetical protein
MTCKNEKIDSRRNSEHIDNALNSRNSNDDNKLSDKMVIPSPDVCELYRSSIMRLFQILNEG